MTIFMKEVKELVLNIATYASAIVCCSLIPCVNSTAHTLIALPSCSGVGSSRNSVGLNGTRTV